MENMCENCVTEKKKCNKKAFLALIGGVVAVALIVILLVTFVFSGKPYQSAVEKYFNAAYAGNFDDLEGMAPKQVFEKNEGSLEEFKKLFEKNWEQNKAIFSEVYGKDFKASMKILLDKQVEENVLKMIAEYIESNYGINKDTVTEAYTVIVEITVEGTKDIDAMSTEIDVVKIDGTWYAVDFDADSEGAYVDFVTD